MLVVSRCGGTVASGTGTGPGTGTGSGTGSGTGTGTGTGTGAGTGTAGLSATNCGLLAACCPTLGANNVAACDNIVASGLDTVCASNLAAAKAAGYCCVEGTHCVGGTSGTGSGTPVGPGPNCATLASCCPTLGAQASACAALVASGSENACNATLTNALAAGLCATPIVGVACTTDAECSVGDFCDTVSGDCVAGATLSLMCATDADCPAPDFCDTSVGFCVADTGAASCVTNAECGVGEICDTSTSTCVAG